LSAQLLISVRFVSEHQKLSLVFHSVRR